jgi:hypothetical protein
MPDQIEIGVGRHGLESLNVGIDIDVTIGQTNLGVEIAHDGLALGGMGRKRCGAEDEA